MLILTLTTYTLSSQLPLRFKKRNRSPLGDRLSHLRLRRLQHKLTWLYMPILGLLTGGTSALTGTGSGVIISPLLLNWGGLKNSQVSPTANAVMIFTTLSGTLAFLSLPQNLTDTQTNPMKYGLIHIDQVLILFVSASLCAYFGRKYQNKLNSQQRKWILGSLLLTLAIKMIHSLGGSLS